MKLQTNIALETQGMQGMETNAFSIKGSAKAFRILLDGLYTNKIRAVIRELWTNAYDSHIEAGMDSIPFDCHLPSVLDPTFRVRDYGVSLTHDQVMHLYTTLFDSTKEETDDMVGALGLGSKSPFAYTDTFTVIARLSGEKRTYLAAIAGDGTPTITHVGTEQSDEAQGLEVILPARGEDLREFENEARLLSVGFDPLPQIDGIEVKPYEPILVGDNGTFAIFPPDVLPGSAQLSIRQGCVIYPVDNYELSQPIRHFLNYRYQAVIDVPIGEVQVTASREALSLDETTKVNVTAAVAGMIAVVGQEVYAKADLCTSHLEAVKFWFGGGNSGDTNSAFNITAKWRGKEIRNMIPLTADPDNVDPKLAWEPIVGRQGKKRDLTKIHGFNCGQLDTLKFVCNYTDNKVVRAVARYRQAVDAMDYREALNCHYLLDPTKRQLEVLTETLGLDATQIVWVGDLKDPGPPERGYGGSSVKGALMGISLVTGHESWDRVTELDLTQDFYWLEVDRVSKDAVNCIATQNYRCLTSAGMPDRPIYLFTKGAAARHNPDKGKLLDTCVTTYRQAGEKKALDIVEQYHYNDVVRHAGLESHLNPTPITTHEYNNATNLLGSTYDGTPYRVARNKGSERAMLLEKQYPLLFQSNNAKAIAWYIAARDAESKS